MKEGVKKNIYYELRTHNVSKEIQDNHTDYTFGRYRIYSWGDYMIIGKLNPSNGAFVHMQGADQDDDYPENDTYAIYIAAKNKHEGRAYIDPYKNIPVNEVIKDSVTRFDKIFTEHAADIFPYDMPEQQYMKTVAEMKDILAQKIKQYKQKQK